MEKAKSTKPNVKLNKLLLYRATDRAYIIQLPLECCSSYYIAITVVSHDYIIKAMEFIRLRPFPHSNSFS